MKKNVGIKRDTAIKLVNELVERAKAANALPKEEVPHKVIKLYIFGSFLSDKEKLGDIDIFYELEEKWVDSDNMMDYFLYHINSNSKEEDFYENPKKVTVRYLRNNKKSYSFHGSWMIEHMEKQHKGFKYKELIIN